MGAAKECRDAGRVASAQEGGGPRGPTATFHMQILKTPLGTRLLRASGPKHRVERELPVRAQRHAPSVRSDPEKDAHQRLQISRTVSFRHSG